MKVQKIARALKTDVYVALAVLLAIVLLGESQILPNGVIEAKSMAETVANMCVVLLTLASVPFAMKAFSRSERVRCNGGEDIVLAQCSKQRRVGQLALVVSAVVSLVAYYLTLNSTGAMCSLLSVCVLMWHFPSDAKMANVIKEKEDEQ